jgi:hypothetical protein
MTSEGEFMARFMRLDVINTLLETGVLPLFYNGRADD